MYDFFNKKVFSHSTNVKLQEKDFFEKFSLSYLEKFKSIYYIKTLVNVEKGKYLYEMYVSMHLKQAGFKINQDIDEIEKISKKAFISGVGGMRKSIL